MHIYVCKRKISLSKPSASHLYTNLAKESTKLLPIASLPATGDVERHADNISILHKLHILATIDHFARYLVA